MRRLLLIVVFITTMVLSAVPMVHAQNGCEPVDTSSWEVFQDDGYSLILPPNEWIDLDLEAGTAAAEEAFGDNPIAASLLEIGANQEHLLNLVSDEFAFTFSGEFSTIGNTPTELIDQAAIFLEESGAVMGESGVVELPFGDAAAYADFTLTGAGFTVDERIYVVTENNTVYYGIFVVPQGNVADLCGEFLTVMQNIKVDSATLGLDVAPVNDGDLVAYTTDNLSFEAPASWEDFNDPALLGTLIDQLTEQNPDFAATIEIIRPQIESGLFEVYLLEVFSGTSMNVVTQDLGIALPLDSFLETLEAQYQQLGFEILENEMLELPLGEVLRIRIQAELNVTATTTTVTEQEQYIAVRGTELFVFTFATTSGGAFDELAPVFRAVMESMSFN